MMPTKFNLTQNRRGAIAGLLLGIGMAVTLAAPGMARGALVAADTARKVAQQQIRRHLDIYGHWNHGRNPRLGEVRPVHFDDHVVAYHFNVMPSGHILVAVDDTFSPVLLYSDRSSFDPDRAGLSGSVESWIIPELSQRIKQWQFRGATAAVGSTAVISGRRIRKAWQLYTQSVPDGARANARIELVSGPSTPDRTNVSSVGPLLTTSWAQDAPYNATMPDAGCSPDGSALVGCVAAAWAQLLRYWRWPEKGVGDHQYDWQGQTLSLDFDAAPAYDWDNMPAMLNVGSPQVQIDAVGQLLYHMAIAADTDFGCDASVSARFADEVLDIYFNFRPDMQLYDRGAANLTDNQWFAFFKNELDADPPRPVVLSIWGTFGGHEVIADGYQSGATDLVHINFGWAGGYDGYYNVTDDFSTGPIDWEANTQIIVTGIEPDNQPPLIVMGADQQVGEGMPVQLDGAASDPEMMGDISYLWTQTAGSSVVLAGAQSPSATFTAPMVNAETRLVFELRATDVNRAFSLGTAVVTVENTDGSLPVDTRSTAGGGGVSGCFIGSLWSGS